MVVWIRQMRNSVENKRQKGEQAVTEIIGQVAERK